MNTWLSRDYAKRFFKMSVSVGIFMALCGIFIIASNLQAQTSEEKIWVISEESKVQLGLAGFKSVALLCDESSSLDINSIYVSNADYKTISSTKKQQIISAFMDGAVLIFEGGEAFATELLDIGVGDQDRNNPPEFFAIKRSPNGNIKRGYFFMSDRYFNSYEVDIQTMEVRTIVDEGVVYLNDDARKENLNTLLKDVFWWATQISSAEYIQLEKESDWVITGPGAWNSIGSMDYVWAGLDISGTAIAVRLTLTVNKFKIQDAYYDRDWYLVETRLHHELPLQYEEGCPLIPFTTSFTGWYVQDREQKIQRTDSSTLAEYGPTGTISSTLYSINIGGGITTDPGAGITAGYSRTVEKPDITITDSGSLYSGYGYWKGAFKCPRGDYSGCPFVEWPANTSKSSYYSYQAAIFRTTNLTSGVVVNITPRALVYKDEIYNAFLFYSIKRYYHDLGSTRTVTLFKNYVPNQPTKPSGPSSGWVNTPYSFSTDGSDHDGDTLTYMFDWGDSQGSYGAIDTCITNVL